MSAFNEWGLCYGWGLEPLRVRMPCGLLKREELYPCRIIRGCDPAVDGSLCQILLRGKFRLNWITSYNRSALRRRHLRLQKLPVNLEIGAKSFRDAGKTNQNELGISGL